MDVWVVAVYLTLFHQVTFRCLNESKLMRSKQTRLIVTVQHLINLIQLQPAQLNQTVFFFLVSEWILSNSQVNPIISSGGPGPFYILRAHRVSSLWAAVDKVTPDEVNQHRPGAARPDEGSWRVLMRIKGERAYVQLKIQWWYWPVLTGTDRY